MKQKEQLVTIMDHLLDQELLAVHRLLVHASRVNGENARELEEFFIKEAHSELDHALLLAKKLYLMGHTVFPAAEYNAVHCKDSTPIQMVEENAHAEADIVEEYGMLVATAEATGNLPLQVEMEDVLIEENKHMEELMKMAGIFYMEPEEEDEIELPKERPERPKVLYMRENEEVPEG